MWKSNVSKSKVQTKFELDQFLLSNKGLLTIVEGPSQPGTASPANLNVTILAVGKTKHIYSFTVRVEMTKS